MAVWAGAGAGAGAGSGAGAGAGAGAHLFIFEVPAKCIKNAWLLLWLGRTDIIHNLLYAYIRTI